MNGSEKLNAIIVVAICAAIAVGAIAQSCEARCPDGYVCSQKAKE